MRKALLSLSVLAVIFVCYFMFSSYTGSTESEGNSPNTESEKKNKDAHLPQVVEAVKLPGYIDFAGEAFPLEQVDVKERLDRELLVNSYWHSNTILNIKRSSRYFPTIERILAEEGVPDDFKYLAVAESGLMNVKSPAGAKGIWQFMKATGREKGLVIDSEIDERMNLEKSTRAACKYLKQLKGQFGSWLFAAAAYNMGGPKLKKTIASQKAKSYWDLNMNQETMRYVLRLAAIKEIVGNHHNYGFYIQEHEKYQPYSYKEVEVSGAVASWADFAAKQGMSYRMLKVYNPWIIDSKLTNKSRRTYKVKVVAD